ncbi:MAG: hypothetical protein KAS32_11070 [Candidatus Peribacteraceae bacterium]|nr:hypothetical protein [Candidatus Peribacteraceae bacterium]
MKVIIKGYLFKYKHLTPELEDTNVYGIVVIQHDSLQGGESRIFSRPYRQHSSVKRAMNKLFKKMNLEIDWQKGVYENYLTLEL